MDDVIITPTSQASSVLSSLASSKLNLARDVALTGETLEYWQLKRFYAVLGINTPFIDRLLTVLRDQSIAVAMSHASALDRIASTIDTPDIPVFERLTDDVLEEQ